MLQGMREVCTKGIQQSFQNKEFKGVWATRDDTERKVTSNIDGNASTMALSKCVSS